MNQTLKNLIAALSNSLRGRAQVGMDQALSPRIGMITLSYNDLAFVVGGDGEVAGPRGGWLA
jgi:hypothetical protein